jgi:hypothetical protein
VQPLKDLKDATGMLRVNADAVILDREDPRASVLLSRDVDARGLIPAKLEGIADQVLEELKQLRALHHHSRQRIMRDDRAGLLHPAL